MVYNVTIDWRDYSNYVGTAVVPVEADSEGSAKVNAEAYICRLIGAYKTEVIHVEKARKRRMQNETGF